MSLEQLFGKSKEVKILDILIPLSNDDEFTIAQVSKGSGVNLISTEKILDYQVNFKILVPIGAPKLKMYRKNSHSNQVWALNNLIHAIYSDYLRADCLKKMEQKDV